MAEQLKVILQAKLSSKVNLKQYLTTKQKRYSNPKICTKLRGVVIPQSARFLPPVFLSLGRLILSMAWWPLKSRCSIQWTSLKLKSTMDFSDINPTPRCLSHLCKDTKTNRARVKAFQISLITWSRQKSKHFPKLKHNPLDNQTFLGVKPRTPKSPLLNYKTISQSRTPRI